MPYASDKQRRYFNAQRGKKVPAAVVDEFNAASKQEGEMGKNSCSSGAPLNANKTKVPPSKSVGGPPGDADEGKMPPIGKKRKKGEISAYLKMKGKSKGKDADEQNDDSND